MSRIPIARNSDLTRLEEEGYALTVASEGYLLVRNVPYVTRERVVKHGTLVGAVTTKGTIEDIVHFRDHTLFFAGEMPCNYDGVPLNKLVINSERRQLTAGITVDHQFSQKPGRQGYPSMYAQVKQYATILESQAQRLEPEVSAKIGPITTQNGEEDSPFVYADTASSRAGIVMVSRKFRNQRIAIVGVGGTGSYVLDQLAKTPVAQIDLFDDDRFRTHNAYRAPGAATVEELRSDPFKVDYWRAKYSAMHKGIIAHPYRITEANAHELLQANSVFLCMDSGPDKLSIVNLLHEKQVPFFDTGIGVEEVSGALRGTVRMTASTHEKFDHIRRRVSFGAPHADDYDRNIQVADLNALNAVLAVIRWKKASGFYHDFMREHHSTYTIGTHSLTKEETTDEAD